MTIETISQITDSVVAILSIALMIYAWNLLAIFRNGRMEMSFKLFTIAPIFLAISNIYGFLSDFNFLPDLYSKWNLQIDDIASILFILTLFLGFFELRKAWRPKNTRFEEIGSIQSQHYPRSPE
jgi:hypothetical protein